MALTPAQKTTLKTHIAANTNTVSVNGGSPVAINSLPMSDPDARAAVVGWYNLTATAASTGGAGDDRTLDVSVAANDTVELVTSGTFTGFRGTVSGPRL